jgi:hypothetical protein
MGAYAEMLQTSPTITDLSEEHAHMNNTTGKALLVGATAALVSSLVASPASAATTTINFVACRHNPIYCINGDKTYTKGTSTRIVDAIGGDRETGVKRTGTYYARWTYKKPGGSTKVGASWKKATVRKIDGIYSAYTGWGHADGKGLKVPKNTVVCVQYKGNSFKVCEKFT